MKIRFLGTGTSQGIPVIGSNHPVCLSTNPKDKRLRVSVLIEIDSNTYVIDCGPDFRQQMLRHDVKQLDAVLFTHEHNDHVVGLDDVRPFSHKQGEVTIYAQERVIVDLKKRFAYVFQEKDRYPGAPKIMVNEVGTAVFKLGNLEVTPIQVLHGKLPILGYRIKDFVYITDAKTIADTELEKLKNVEVLVVNALRREPHHSHFNLSEALAFIEKVKPTKAYLTHISHLMGFHEEVEKELPKNVFLAYDNLTITL
ncbi:phosphoribosyl 1,2-cyclic phosphate phosphodiesterase [Mesonia hippocampi]|uniref:Phosphoribosyl 1,2-cyclic phosphate phosphodiesterase n=1 Tax=Mesonia hippocampi TaxID=1628250 RepID=A0A840EHT9_9FLAO|nr:phosphoribosyl 1,2-cyclic phosphate phosphodiesterase [Mesonia hippocampi]